jgi:hypothetical protein
VGGAHDGKLQVTGIERFHDARRTDDAASALLRMSIEHAEAMLAKYKAKETDLLH